VLSSNPVNVVPLLVFFLAGPVTNRLGYRWTTILALILMNATIFISFFVSSPIPLLSLSPDRIHFY